MLPMEKYSIKYMETHCIDVFFACGQYPIHILTAGSIIPDALNDILRNRTLQEEVERNVGASGPASPSTNSAYIQSLINKHLSVLEECRGIKQFQGINKIDLEPDANQIPAHFLAYAKLGFYSYDCSEVKDDGTAVYRLMAWPDKTFQLNYDLPQFAPKGFSVSGNVPPLPEYIEL